MNDENTFPCKFGCNTMIYFRYGFKKPFEADNDIPHECPKLQHEKNDFIGQEIMDLEQKERDRFGF